MLCNRKPTAWREASHRSEGQPPLCNQREPPGAASKTQHGQEFKMINHLKEVDPTFSINLPGSLSCSQEINAEGCILAFFPSLLYDLKILS